MPTLIPPRGLTMPRPERRAFPRSHHLNTYPAWAEGFATSAPTVYAVTTGGSADTDGSWVELDASTEADIYELEITCAQTSQNATNTSGLLDIGVGGSGSEAEIVSDVQVGYLPATLGTLVLPVFIPAGSRVAARARCAVASKTFNMRVRPRSSRAGRKPARYLTTYGSVPASSRGTIVTQPGGANSKGAWTELTAATTERLAGLVVCVGSGSNNMNAMDILLDIGVGGAGSETVLIPDLHSRYTGNEVIYAYGLPRVYSVDLPTGTRIAARQAKTSVTTNHNCHVLGVPWRP